MTRNGSRTQRAHQWWLHRDDDPDLDLIASTVRASDWVAFAGDDGDAGAPPPVAMRLSRAADGRMVCSALIIGMTEAFNGQAGRAEVNSTDLRDVPINELISRAVSSAVSDSYFMGGRAVITDRAPALSVVKRNPGPKGYPREHFEAVGALYRRALVESPGRPIVWMTKEIPADRSTVNRWLKRARELGYLGDSIPGKAGEKTEGE